MMLFTAGEGGGGREGGAGPEPRSDRSLAFISHTVARNDFLGPTFMTVPRCEFTGQISPVSTADRYSMGENRFRNDLQCS